MERNLAETLQRFEQALQGLTAAVDRLLGLATMVVLDDRETGSEGEPIAYLRVRDTSKR